MILKASQRAGARQLAQHLMNTHDNEHVEIHELRGFVANDLQGALQEAYCVSRSTKCKQFMFSLSLNPPQGKNVPVEDFEAALAKIEQKLGLEGQPRAVVFHEKENRRHCHCVWSRIHIADDGHLKAVQLSHFKNKLNDIAHELYIAHGWKLPEGFKNKQNHDPRNFTLAQWQQAKRTNQDPRAIKATLQQCWAHSDSKASFEAALTDAGYMLARGDRRGFVAVDWYGEIYSLSRMMGVKTKDLKTRLGAPDRLRSASSVKASMSKELKVLYKRLSGEIKEIHIGEVKPLLRQKDLLLKEQRKQRQVLKHKLKQRYIAETQTRQERFGKGLKRVWWAMTGKSKITRKQNEAEYTAAKARDEAEKQTLITKQLAQRHNLQARIIKLRKAQREDMAMLTAGFVRVMQGHQKLEELHVTFGRAAMRGVEQARQHRHSNDNKPEIGL